MKFLSKKAVVAGVLGAVVLGAASNVAAGGSWVKRGFYLGLAGGVGTQHSSVDQKFPDPTITDGSNDFDLSGVGGVGDVRLGWETPFGREQKGYFSAELTGGFSTIKGNNRIDANTGGTATDRVTLRERYSFSGSGKLGWIFEGALSYIKLGARFSEWELESDFRVVASDKDRNRTGHWGFDAGLGFQIPLNDRFSFNGEYVYTFFQSKSFKDDENIEYGYRPQSQRFMVGLTWHIPWKKFRR